LIQEVPGRPQSRCLREHADARPARGTRSLSAGVRRRRTRAWGSAQRERLEVWENFSHLPAELLSPFFFYFFLFHKFYKLLPCLKGDPESPPLGGKVRACNWEGARGDF